jgi:hypothetical protein
MFKFEFSEQHTREIAAVLEGAPYRVAAPILAEMQKQISAQQKQSSAQGNGKENLAPLHKTDETQSANSDA